MPTRRTIVLSAALAIWIASLFTGGVSALAQQAPKRGGTAVVAIDTDPPTLNPTITTGTTEMQVASAIFSSLVWLDPKWQPQPYLAESWTVAADGLTYTFRLRRNVKWHDGKAFTAADVKFTFDEVLSKYHPMAKAAFEHVSAVETPDPHTVVVRMKKAYAPFLFFMNNYSGMILPKHVYEGTDILKNPHNLRPIGTGPFKFQDWKRGDRVVVVRNDEYFEAGLPLLDRIIFKIMPDVNARAIAIQTGELDYMFDYYFGREAYPTLSRLPTVTMKFDADFPSEDQLIFNVRKGPLASPKVRQAIAHAIERKTIVDRVYLGLADVGRSAIDTRLAWAYNPAIDYQKMYPFDPKKAAALLDEAGFRAGGDGTRFPLRLIFDVRRGQIGTTAELIREQLRRVGIPVQLEPTERGVMIDKLFKNWDFDMTIQTYSTFGEPAVGIQRLYLCREIRKAPFVNVSGYCNSEVDRLFERGATMPKVEDRAQAYREAQVLLAKDLPVLILVEKKKIDVARTRLKGLWQSATGWTFWAPVWIGQD